MLLNHQSCCSWDSKQLIIMFNSSNLIKTFPTPDEWGMNWSSMLLTMMMLLMNQSGCSWNEWQLIIMFMSFNIINTLSSSNKWGMNWASMLLIRMKYQIHPYSSSRRLNWLKTMFYWLHEINTLAGPNEWGMNRTRAEVMHQQTLWKNNSLFEGNEMIYPGKTTWKNINFESWIEPDTSLQWNPSRKTKKVICKMRINWRIFPGIFIIMNILWCSNEWGMNWSSMLLTMMMLLNHQSCCCSLGPKTNENHVHVIPFYKHTLQVQIS